MKIGIYVFSGTGNTLAVARLYKTFAEKVSADVSVEIFRLVDGSEFKSPDEFDMIGVGFPVHAFSAPEPALDFCKALAPIDTPKRAFVFMTSGEGLRANERAADKCVRLLVKRGYDVLSARHIVMPYNMIFRHTDGMAKHIWIYAHALVDAHSRGLVNGTHENVRKYHIKSLWLAPIGLIERKFARSHGPRFKVDADKCIGCDKCIRACPKHNIKKADGKFVFGHDCVLCMGCSFGCPENAVSVGVFKYWKVNGSYRLDELKADASIPFPVEKKQRQKFGSLYKRYYRRADRRLFDAGLQVEDYA